MRCPQSGHLKRAAFVPEMLIPHDTHLRVPRCWLSLIPHVSPGRHLTLLKHGVTRHFETVPSRFDDEYIREQLRPLPFLSGPAWTGGTVTTMATTTRQSRAELFEREASEVRDDRQYDAVDELYAPEFESGTTRAGTGTGTLGDREAIESLHAEWHEAFPDVEVEVTTVLDDGDTVLAA